MQVDQIQELENDSDYEDLDDDDDDIDEATVLTSMLDRDLLKVTIIFFLILCICFSS